MGIYWENSPATEWMNGYPIGNGRHGAMIFGGVCEERIQMNLDSICYGGHVDRINPDARKNLEQIREWVLKGNIKEAEECLTYAFSGTPQGQRPYQPLGWLEMWYPEMSEEYKEYKRELILERGIVEEHFLNNCTEFKKTYFASYPAGVLVVRISASGEKKVNAKMILSREKFYENTGRIKDDTIFMRGQAGPGGVHFFAAVRALPEGGNVKTIGEHLIIEQCDAVTLLIAGETSFYTENPEEAAMERLHQAEQKGYQALLMEHEKDYSALFNRTRFSLCAITKEDISLSERIRKNPEDPALAESYFQFGRYLMISGSRPGSLALNLQGIWCEKMTPPWDSKYTININTEMNYWPAESCGLPECHEPLFDLLKRVCESGKETAKRMYGCRGFVAHHNTDIWADTAPQDIYIPASYWVMGGAWICTHIMTHYRYTQDREFLKEMYGCLKEAVEFFEDFLIEDHGELVTCPSVSPENTYIMKDGTTGCICAGCAMDSEILTDLFMDYMEASEILGIEIKEDIKHILEKFPKLKIGKHGQIQEWREDYDELEPGHRHISHLYALYPSMQISKEKTPELLEAAKKTVERRLAHGGGYTGWSCAWMICMAAKLGDGELAWRNLRKLFAESTGNNLMDTHPGQNGAMFQIDGNFGATAGIAEMLVHSEPRFLKLLPALPEQWKNGSITGIRIMNQGTVDLKWEQGMLVSCQIKAGQKELDLEVSYRESRQTINVKPNEIRVLLF